MASRPGQKQVQSQRKKLISYDSSFIAHSGLLKHCLYKELSFWKTFSPCPCCLSEHFLMFILAAPLCMFHLLGVSLDWGVCHSQLLPDSEARYNKTNTSKKHRAYSRAFSSSAHWTLPPTVLAVFCCSSHCQVAGIWGYHQPPSITDVISYHWLRNTCLGIWWWCDRQMMWLFRHSWQNWN